MVGRDRERLAEVEQRLGVTIAVGNVGDPTFTSDLLREVRPTVVVLNAGAHPELRPLHEQTWEAFTEAWNTDVKAGLHWLQEAIRLPLPRGSRVLVTSSGAAVGGSPRSRAAPRARGGAGRRRDAGRRTRPAAALLQPAN